MTAYAQMNIKLTIHFFHVLFKFNKLVNVMLLVSVVVSKNVPKKSFGMLVDFDSLHITFVSGACRSAHVGNPIFSFSLHMLI